MTLSAAKRPDTRKRDVFGWPMSEIEAAGSRVRRLRDAVQAVRDAVAADGNDNAVPDAVARSLDALYDLAEVVKSRGGHTNKILEELATGDVGGETTLGLLCARGAKTHALVNLETFTPSARTHTARARMAVAGPGSSSRMKIPGSAEGRHGTPAGFGGSSSWIL